MTAGYASPEFYLNPRSATAFWTDSNGYMHSSDDGRIMVTERTGGGLWMQFTEVAYQSAHPTVIRGTCSRNFNTGILTCYQTNTNVIYVRPDDMVGYYGYGDGSTLPMFGCRIRASFRSSCGSGRLLVLAGTRGTEAWFMTCIYGLRISLLLEVRW